MSSWSRHGKGTVMGFWWRRCGPCRHLQIYLATAWDPLHWRGSQITKGKGQTMVLDSDAQCSAALVVYLVHICPFPPNHTLPNHPRTHLSHPSPHTRTLHTACQKILFNCVPEIYLSEPATGSRLVGVPSVNPQPWRFTNNIPPQAQQKSCSPDSSITLREACKDIQVSKVRHAFCSGLLQHTRDYSN